MFIYGSDGGTTYGFCVIKIKLWDKFGKTDKKNHYQ